MLDLTGSTPPDVEAHRLIRADAAALLREVWQQFPKTMPVLIDPEEDPDDN